MDWIIELSRRTASPWYFRVTGRTLTQDPNGFQSFVRSKYETEPGEIFRHPVRFLELNGDCDDQTIFFLSNWFSERLLFGNVKPVQIVIAKNKKFLHISQFYGGKIFDFLPYKWPNGTQIIYRKAVN